jgi:hypothetical protein
MTYTVNTQNFDSFLKAVNYAKDINAEVYEVATGLRRWAPAAAPSSKKMRLYKERMAAYNAQQAAK